MVHPTNSDPTIKRHVVDFGRARYAFVEIECGAIIRTAYAPETSVDWLRLEKLARAATTEAQ